MTIDVKSYPGIPANQRGWGSGWPNCQFDKWVVAPKPIFGQAHQDVVLLLAALVAETEKRGYKLKGDGLTAGTSQCWGADCRAIKTSTGLSTDVPSNHSWALAVDINSLDNQYGSTSWTVPGWMVTLWNTYGWRWGGDYPHTKDPMHFEFMGTPAEAKMMLAKALADFAGEEDEDVGATQADYQQRAFTWGESERWLGNPRPTKSPNIDPAKDDENYLKRAQAGWDKADADPGVPPLA